MRVLYRYTSEETFRIFNLSYSNYRIQNDINPATADTIRLQSYLNDVTHQFSISSNYDLRIKVLHRFLLNVITSRKKDYTYRNLSAKFYTINLSIQNFWSKTFNTFLGSTISESEIAASKYHYYSFNVGSESIQLETNYEHQFQSIHTLEI